MLFDDILREIGEFGLYQIISYIILGSLAIPAGWQNLAITFYSNKLHSHWCKVKELDGLSDSVQWNVAIPSNNDDNTFKYDKCKMYNLNYSKYTIEDFLNWNRSISLNAKTMDCNDGWNFLSGYRTVMKDVK